MSSSPSPSGAPIPKVDIIEGQPVEQYVYSCLPQLGPARPGDKRPSLLPKYGGQPGLTYAQWPIAQLKTAQQRGWMRLHGAAVYTIKGPKGSVDCELLARGKLIRGLAPTSGARQCKIHKSIIETTGLDINTGFPPVKAPVKESTNG